MPDADPPVSAQWAVTKRKNGTRLEAITPQLACGAFDELATQNRYLELKYDGGGALKG